jgi:integrase
MSVQADRDGWVVRWRDGSGRQRGKRFSSREAAQAFDAGLREVAPRERRSAAALRAGGIYHPYPTKRGTRWYFKARGSDGAQVTRRGFTSEKAARDAKRRLTEQVERGEVRHTRESFGSDWHKEALRDAGLRDMPLHALRHTAVAAWLAASNSLMYVQRQLGHADTRTTEHYYGHLERHVLAAGAVATEEAIARAATRR